MKVVLNISEMDVDDGFEDALREVESVESVESPDAGESAGIEPVTAVLLLLLGAGGVTAIADWFRRRNAPFLIIDARTEPVTIIPRPELYELRGKVVIVSPDNVQVAVETTNGAIDLDGLIVHVLEDGVAAVVEAAKGEARVLDASERIEF